MAERAAPETDHRPQLQSVWILGTPISIVSMGKVIDLLEEWVAGARDHYVVFRDVHGVMLARNEPQLRRAHIESDLVAPDGMPLVWAARLAGSKEISRVCGPDLLLVACEHGLSRGWRHYFYGGAPGVAEDLERELRNRFPGIDVVGTYSPPFQSLSAEEDDRASAAIRAAHPHFVWVGLGTPKQELWMAEHCGKCGGATLLGIGGAFDLHAGLVPRAPGWMQSLGLEWCHRLACEPRRLWRRYFTYVPLFLVLVALELITRRIGKGR